MEDTSEEANKKQLEKLTAINERYKQEIYDLKLKLNIAEAMEQEAVHQVESVQAELAKEKARSSHLLAQHSKEIALLNRQWMEKLEAVEQNFSEEKGAYEDKIAKLKENIAELKNVSVLDSTETVIELQKLKSSNQELAELICGLEEKLAKERHQSVNLESLVQDLSHELEVAKGNFKQKKEELTSSQELIDNVQGEATQLKLELEMMKAAGASHLNRGNSLFAEVEDRRKVLQGHLDAARAKLLKTRAALKNKDTEICKLRADKSYLSLQFKKLEKECKLTDTQWHSTYSQRIQELERTLSELRNVHHSTQPRVVGEDNFQWVSQLLANKQAQMRRLEETLEEKSVSCLMGADCLLQTRRTLQATRAELLCAKATILDLKMALLTANPGIDIDSDEICDEAGTGLLPVNEEPQDCDKENVASADVQKTSLTEHNLAGKHSCSPLESVVETASKRELSDVTSTIVNANVNSDEINFPFI